MIHWQGDHETPLEFVIAKNLKRRHLTASQRAVVALDVLPLLEQAARKRQLEQGVHGGKGGRGNKRETLPEKIPEGFSKSDSEARTQVAQRFQANPRYVSDAKRIQK